MFSMTSSQRGTEVLLTLGFLAIATVTGLVISTGKPILIALAMGALLGTLMLSQLLAVVWMILAGVMLCVGPIGYFMPQLSKLNWMFSVLGIFLLGASILYVGIGKRHYQTPVPVHSKLAIALLIWAFVTLFFHNGVMAEMTGAFKRQFHFFGLLLCLTFVPFTENTVRQWLKFLVFVAVVQLPVALYQRFILVPQVEGLEKPGFVALDIVVGTFEGSPTGGGASAVMAMFAVLVGVGLICAVREKVISKGWFFLLFPVVVAPLALGETKVVLLLIPVALLGAFGDSVFKRPAMFIGGTVVTLMISAALVYVYFLVQVDDRQMTFHERVEETLSYNVGQNSYYDTGVNRMTAVPYWFESHHVSDPARMIFGYGMGASYGSDGRAPVRGYVWDEHPGMYIDLTSAASLLWDYGIVGAFLWLAIAACAWWACMRSLDSAVSGMDRAFCRAMAASVAASTLMLIYSASVLAFPTHTMLYWLTLALIAWRVRHGPFRPDLETEPVEQRVSAHTLMDQMASEREFAFPGDDFVVPDNGARA